MTKPFLLVIHGSFAHQIDYVPFLKAAQQNGYEAECPQLPSSGAQPPVGLKEDALLINARLKLLKEQQKKVIVICSSYGGMVANEAIEESLLHTDSTGGVCQVIWVASFLVDEGEELRTPFGNQLPPWIHIDQETGICQALQPQNTIFSDLTDSKEIERVARDPISVPFKETQCVALSRTLYRSSISLSYIICSDDQALPASFQQMMVSRIRSRYPDLQITIRSIASGHLPFLSQPIEVLKTIETLI